MKLSNKQFKEKISKKRPVRKVSAGVIGETMYDIYSDGSFRNPRKLGKES